MEEDIQIMAVRNYSFSLIVLYLSIKYIRPVMGVGTSLILLSSYLLALSFLSSDPLRSVNFFTVFFVPFMMFPLGFIATKSMTHIQRLYHYSLKTHVLFVLSILVFSIFRIGNEQYEGGSSLFRSGYFTFSNIYIGSYLLVISPLVYPTLNKKIHRGLYVTLCIITMLILLLSMRRTSIAIVVIVGVSYAIANRRHLAATIKRTVAVVVVMIAAFPFYQPILIEQMESRSYLFDKNEGIGDEIQGETRYIETIAVWKERIETKNIEHFLIGNEMFNSIGNYDRGRHGARPLHLDLTVILHGSGIIGLILYFLVHIQMIRMYFRIKKKLPSNSFNSSKAIFVGIFASIIMLFFSGSLDAMSFRIVAFLYLGGILGVFSSEISKQDRVDS